MYGVVETNSLGMDVSEVQDYISKLDDMCIEEFIDRGGRFTRIRLLTDRGYPFFDLSYVWGRTADGVETRVYGIDGPDLPRKTYRSVLAKTIKDAGGDPNKMGVWDSGVYSILYG